MNHPKKPIQKAVAVVGCKHTTKELILGLERYGYTVDHCLTITPQLAGVQQVAGYMDLRPFLKEKGIPYTLAQKYSLKTDEDRGRLLSLKLDLLLVMGWQRLIPDWWLESLSIGAFGMHGSSRPLPHGRGRSPMNWSLIQNKNIFYTHLFQYKPGVDDGPVVGVQMFDITPFDTCLTLHFKNTVAMIQLCATHLPNLLDGSARLSPQPQAGASYYPKRSAEDGLIYWTDTTLEIYNLIRAVTRPFPGAFTCLDDDPERIIFIWRAIPFDTHLTWPAAAAGEIVEVFDDGSFVVKTGDSSLLVIESEGHQLNYKDVGRRFGPQNQPRKVWEQLPT
jgi:methionyl-tRNA formyltransferase